MFIVYGYDHPKGPGIHFVSGIFRHRQDAEDYLHRIPEKFPTKHRLEEIPQIDYPIYFIEEDFKKGPARPIDRFELAKKMAMMPKVDDENHVYFNYYRFMEDYRGIKPGEDYMGSTDHTHVTNDDIIWSIEGTIRRGEVKHSSCYFFCNMCGNPGSGRFRSDHWLPPENWIIDSAPLSNHDQHIPKVFCDKNCQKAWHG